MAAADLAALRSRARGISLGLFAGDVGALRKTAATVQGWGAALAHFDIMDGVFVPQLTGGPAFVTALDRVEILRDVHLMVAQPSRHVSDFVMAGAHIVTVHAEAPDCLDALHLLRETSAQIGRPVLAGVAVMPGTDLASLVPLMQGQPDLILSLALDPRNKTRADIGLAGDRLQQLADMARRAGGDPLLAIDGGITVETTPAAASFGPDIIVSGSAVLQAVDPASTFATMAAAMKRAS